jgi:hypothetical protein
MGMRRPKSTTHSQYVEWGAWKDQHQNELEQIGLPLSLYADEDCWVDFLENGHLHSHQDPWSFEFTQLNKGQMAALLRFLEREYGQRGLCPPLLRWVRVRCGQSGTA